VLSPGSGFPQQLDAAPAAGCGPCRPLPRPWSSSSLRCARPEDAGGESPQETRSLGFLPSHRRSQQPREGEEQQTRLAAPHPPPSCCERPKPQAAFHGGGLRLGHPAPVNTRRGRSRRSLLAFLLFFVWVLLFFNGQNTLLGLSTLKIDAGASGEGIGAVWLLFLQAALGAARKFGG